MFPACGTDQYDCEDLTCIASELRCNQVENCRFRWDEDGCPVNFNLIILLFLLLFNILYYTIYIILGRRQQINAAFLKF